MNTLFVGVIAVAALYLGSSIFVPLVLAVLLTFALSPVVRALQRIGVPHVLAALMTVATAGAVLAGLSFLVVTEVAHLATEIPKYQQVVANKLLALQKSTTSGDVVERVVGALQNILAALPDPEGATAPVPVRIVDPAVGPLGFGQAFLGSVLGPLATSAIVTLFVIFLLVERENFRDRFLKLVSSGDLRTTTRAMTDAGRRVSRYLLVQFVVNASYGTLFGLGLFFIGIPDALLWGLLAGLFRYIPFVGTIIAAVIPLALSFAIDPQWSKLVAVVGLFVALEMTITNAVEPRLYGSSTGLSALAVLVAAMFWATLWGPIGLILATPLTVCLVVLGRYVPQLAFLETMLGSEPVLAPDEQLYQRLVSGNAEEAIDLAEQYVDKSGSPQEFYDSVAIPALRFAETDRARDGGDLAERRLVAESMDAVVQELANLWPETTENPAALSVLCIGGRTELDGAAASMIAQSLSASGVTVRLLPPVSLRRQGIGQLELDHVDVVCIAYLDAAAAAYLKNAARHIHRRSPAVAVVGCLLSESDEPIETPQGVAQLCHSIASVQEFIKSQAPEQFSAGHTPGPSEPLHRLARPSAQLADFATKVSTELTVPIAMVVMADSDGDKTASQHELAPLRDYILENGATAADAGAWRALMENPFMVENGFGAAAGVPVIIDGRKSGALLVFDQAGRAFSASDVNRLADLAASFVTETNPELAPTRTQREDTQSTAATPNDLKEHLRANPL
ncbi:AI-2E family transporter [Devosia sp.]|uniref:AI-2E family transporter n=1 Tax=Devosia sp. TaxID=1871048 RepID=UPI003BACEEBA